MATLEVPLIVKLTDDQLAAVHEHIDRTAARYRDRAESAETNLAFACAYAVRWGHADLLQALTDENEN